MANNGEVRVMRLTVWFLLFQMASVIHQSQKTPSDAYGCNWLQRLRQIKRIQSRVTSAAEFQGAAGPACRRTRKDLHDIVDFTGYIH